MAIERPREVSRIRSARLSGTRRAGLSGLLRTGLAVGFVALLPSAAALAQSGESITVASTKRDVAALLAVEAFRAQPDAAAESALLNSFTEAPGFMGYTTVPYYVVQGDRVLHLQFRVRR